MPVPPARARRAFARLFNRYGPQEWWPAKTRFEVMIGAVLTQNTAWRNVELALANLRARGALSLRGVQRMRAGELARCLRPAGYYNVKAARVRALCEWLDRNGGVAALERQDTDALRRALLSVHGVGPETADAILLYALRRPVFVVDAYARRLAQRLGWISGDEPYDSLRQGFEAALQADVDVFNEYHALIVMHGKTHCRVQPLCAECCLRSMCRFRPAIAVQQRRVGA